MLEDVLRIPHLSLGLEIDAKALIADFEAITAVYPLRGYRTVHKPAERFYRENWSGICLTSSDGGLYTDMSELARPGSQQRFTKALERAPYMKALLERFTSDKIRGRIMKISQGGSLFWHSHVLEHGQPPHILTCQIPIVVPPGFRYGVIDAIAYKASDLTQLQVHWADYRPGEAYIFNSFHYHNVFNDSNQDRYTLMLYLNYKTAAIRQLIDAAMAHYRGPLLSSPEKLYNADFGRRESGSDSPQPGVEERGVAQGVV
ncbi:MAG: aspartyl/asparaginyl beta-hydroxylase domain-containing protein [Candidatus Competibacterales bacterium]